MLSIKELFKFSSKISAANLIGGGFAAAANILVARRLGPEGLGVVGLVQIWLLYAGFLRPGILQAGSREMLHAAGQGRPEDAERIESVALAAEGAFVALPLTVLLAGALFWYEDPVLRASMGVAAVSFLATSLFRLVDSIQWAYQRFETITRANALMKLSSPVFLVGGLYAFGSYGVIAAPGAAAALVLAFYLVRKDAIRWRFSFDRPEMARLFAIGFPLALYSFLYWGFRTSGRLLTASCLSVADLGYLTFAMMLINHGCQWISDFLNVLQANLFSELGKTGAVRPLSLKLQRINILLVLTTCSAAGAAQALFAPMTALFVPKFLPAVPAFEILALNLVSITAPLLAISVLISKVVNRQSAMTAIQAGGLVVNVAAGYLLIRLGWGLEGVAWSGVGAQLLVAMLAYRLLHPHLFGTEDGREARVFYGWVTLLIACAFGAHFALRQIDSTTFRAAGVATFWLVLAGAVYRYWWLGHMPPAEPTRPE